MDKPQVPQITPTDPRLQAEAARADADNLAALQSRATGDTASLMARYGTRLALAGATGASGTTPAAGPSGPAFGSPLLNTMALAAVAQGGKAA